MNQLGHQPFTLVWPALQDGSMASHCRFPNEELASLLSTSDGQYDDRPAPDWGKQLKSSAKLEAKTFVNLSWLSARVD